MHGGGGNNGDKAGDREINAGIECARRGYVTVSINYKLAYSTGGVWSRAWPQNFVDAKTAVRWLRAHAADYNLDTNRIAALGFSWGGNLASMLANTRPSDYGGAFEPTVYTNYSSAIQVGADYYAALDIPGYHNMKQFSGAQTNPGDPGTMDHPTYTPDYLNASPRTWAHEDAVPMLYGHGDADPDVEMTQTFGMWGDAVNVGARTRYLVVPRGEHTFYLIDTSHGGTSSDPIDVRPETFGFFDRYLYGPRMAGPFAATGTVGVAFGYQIVANNSPTSYEATGLPAGLTVNTGTGLISGIPLAAGISTVTIKASNGYGVETATLTITIVAGATPPVALFSASPTNGVEPLYVSFTDASSNSPTGWSWSFGDGGTSALQSPSHTYTTAGVYTVGLIATNGGGSHTNTKAGYITVITAAQSWQNYYGVAPDSSDPFGKGINNSNQFLAGFNPTNPAAYPRVLSVQAAGADMNVTYLGSSGDNSYAGGPQYRTNVLEYSAGNAGSYSNNFGATGVSQVLSNGTGSGSVSTMTEPGGATNVPSRYYRVRVVVP
jgi:PKD repeat protein